MQRLPGEVHWSITESDRPKGRDLTALEGRAAALRSFPAASVDTRKAMIARLFLRFPSGGKATEEEVACYAMDVAEFPFWAIAAGISDIIAGLVLKTPEFRPSSLQVRAAVAARAEPVREELAAISAVLDAKVVPDSAVLPTPERRKAMADQAREMMRQCGVAAEIPQKRHPKIASRFDDAHARTVDHTTSLSLSNEAYRSMTGHDRPKQAEDAA